MRLILLFAALLSFILSCSDSPTANDNEDISVNFIQLLNGYREIPQFFYIEESNLLLIQGRKEFTNDYTVSVIDGSNFKELAIYENASILSNGYDVRLGNLVATDEYLLLTIEGELYRMNLNDLNTTPFTDFENGWYPQVLKGNFGVGIEFKDTTSTYIYTVVNLETGAKVVQDEIFDVSFNSVYAFQIPQAPYIYYHGMQNGIDILELDKNTGQIVGKTTSDLDTFESFENFATNSEKTKLFSRFGNIYSLKNNIDQKFQFAGQFDAIHDEEVRFEPMYVLPSVDSEYLLYFGTTDSIQFNLPSLNLIKLNNEEAFNTQLPLANTENYPTLDSQNVLPIFAYISDGYINILMEYRQEQNINYRNYFIEQYLYEDFFNYLINLNS